MKTNKAYQRPKTPDKILILKVMAPTSDGDIFARPVFWDEVGDCLLYTSDAADD